MNELLPIAFVLLIDVGPRNGVTICQPGLLQGGSSWLAQINSSTRKGETELSTPSSLLLTLFFCLAFLEKFENAY